MAIQNVNPTRMELTKLKTQLDTARRGHHLLKDKQDELIRQFMLIINEYKKLREEVESKLLSALNVYDQAQVSHTKEEIYEKVMIPSQSIDVIYTDSNVMSVYVPKIDYHPKKANLTFSLIDSDQSFDESILLLGELLPNILKLAELDKQSRILIKEIEKTRRRVNAIEFLMIPDLEETIKSIRMKLSDNERSNTIRIMKSKEIVMKKNKR